MKNSFPRIVLCLIFLFTVCSVSFAATSELKIYSEAKGTDIYVDNQLKGTDSVVIPDIKPGSYYVKAMLSGNVIFSKVVDVTEGQSNSVLIQLQGQTTTPQTQPIQQTQTQQIQPPPAAVGMYAQKSEYMHKRILVQVKRRSENDWSSATNIAAYGAQRNISDNNVEWRIVTGDNNKLKDTEFCNLIGDKDMLKTVNDKRGGDVTWTIVSVTASIVGMVVSIGGVTADPFNAGAFVGGLVVSAVGGVAAVLYIGDFQNYHFEWNYAADKAYAYNLKLKSDLGLPQEYEPGL